MGELSGLSCLWKYGRSILGALLLVGVVGVGGALAEEKTVAEQILDILKKNNQITEEQYGDLMQKAKAEKAKAPAKESKESDFEVSWKDGLQVQSKDKAFKVKVGGRIQTDFAVIDADDELEKLGDRVGEDISGHGMEFRRARMYIEGTMFENTEWKAEFDFTDSEAKPADVWIGLKDLPYIGHLKVGHMKEPFSLEEITSSRFNTFMERALPNAFSPARNMGVMIHNAELDERLTWAVGGFEETDDDTGDTFTDFSDWDVTVRVTGLPWYEEKGRQLVHLGLGYTHKFRDDGSNALGVRFRNRPETHITDLRLADTGNIQAVGADVINPEFALVYGPFSLQGEYFYSFVTAGDQSGFPDDPAFSGFYVYASYFLTGENRVYKPSAGAFDRVRPLCNFNPKKGTWGAFETAVRYSQIDLVDDDANIRGGKEDNITLGLNWYFNPNMKMMFNYVYADVEDRTNLDDEGIANIFETRFQIDY